MFFTVRLKLADKGFDWGLLRQFSFYLQSYLGNSTVTVSGRKSNWEVIEHYRNSGEPPALMATMSHTGVARIDSAKGDSSYAQHSYTVEDPASDDTQSTDESILKDHSDNWWNVLALCSRVFRYAAAIEDF